MGIEDQLGAARIRARVLEESHQAIDQQGVQARIEFIYQQHPATVERTEQGANQADPDLCAQGFVLWLQRPIAVRDPVRELDCLERLIQKRVFRRLGGVFAQFPTEHAQGPPQSLEHIGIRHH